MNAYIPQEIITSKIYLIRNQKVMLDKDLSQLYGVETKQLKRQVRRNIERFPNDFMFELTTEELENLRSQFGTSSWGGTRYIPMAFTEQGIAMLSSVLSSPTAIAMNIQIIRAFTKMRRLILSHKDILLKLEEMEKKTASQDEKIQSIFNYLKQFISQQETPIKKIGFRK